MKLLPPLDFYYAWMLLLAAAAFGPPVGCVNESKQELRRLDALRRHQRTTAPGQREVIVRGKARGALVANPLGSPLGQQCLAWRHEILADRTSGTGKNRKTVHSRICSEQPQNELLVEVPGGELLPVSGLTLRLNGHTRSGRVNAPQIRCPQLSKSDMDNATFFEACLVDGDEVEAWACRSHTGALVPCGDLGDYLAAPPDRGPVDGQREQVAKPLCFGTVWLMVGVAVLVFFLSNRVQSTRREPSSQEAS